MRLTVTVDGRPVPLEVSADLQTVEIAGHRYPVRLVHRSPGRVELEIAGEAVTVDGWPDGVPSPAGPVDVNGERSTVAVRAEGGGLAALTGPSGPAATAGGARPEVEGAVAVVPPMPGRVVEVRVREGETVAKGAVLLVLEAMKMRNEIPAPVDGVVRELRVQEGSNVRARETLLLLAPK